MTDLWDLCNSKRNIFSRLLYHCLHTILEESSGGAHHQYIIYYSNIITIKCLWCIPIIYDCHQFVDFPNIFGMYTGRPDNNDVGNRIGVNNMIIWFYNLHTLRILVMCFGFILWKYILPYSFSSKNQFPFFSTPFAFTDYNMRFSIVSTFLQNCGEHW